MQRATLLALLLTATRTAADVGEIAVIEDVGNAISSSFLPQGYVTRASCAFYDTHQDQYDLLVFFTTTTPNLMNATPAGWPVKSPAKGIGLDGWPNQSAAYCSKRLRQAINMSALATVPDDPDASNTTLPIPYTGIEILGHELGLQWLAYVAFDKGDGERRCLLRAFGSANGADTSCDGHAASDFGPHWSYYLNSGSLMYGNTIEDLGGGKFRLSNKGPRYSPLDQYLMGLRAKRDVPPMFLVEGASPDLADSSLPPLAPGKSVEITGTRLDFTVDDVIRAEGARVPASEGCHWKAAFALIHATGKPPTAAQIAKVDVYRRRLEAFYAWATEGRGSVDTTLAGSGSGTAGCPSSSIQPDGAAGLSDGAAPILDTGPDASAPGADSPPTSGDDGCGCHAAGRGGGCGPLWPLLLLGLGLFPKCRRPTQRRLLRHPPGSPGCPESGRPGAAQAGRWASSRAGWRPATRRRCAVRAR